jgi:isopentenyl phosphate kinase
LIGDDVVIIKLGGSSITNKAKSETLDVESLNWVSRTIAQCIDDSYLSSQIARAKNEGEISDHKCELGRTRRASFVVVHGAGSFGHQSAKAFGLRGQSEKPTLKANGLNISEHDRRRLMEGLSKTRRSVQKLNGHVVSHLIQYGINAVGISPCISIPGMQAHGGDELGAMTSLVAAIKDTLSAGLVPVIHGDAGLYGSFDHGRESMKAGILGGDILVEAIATHRFLKNHLSQVIFLTDVEGVFTKDPNIHKDAQLLKTIEIDPNTGKIMANNLNATGSSHEHDVTGGLEAKLGSAAIVARSGTEVRIVKCNSVTAEQSIKGMETITKGTIIRLCVQ